MLHRKLISDRLLLQDWDYVKSLKIYESRKWVFHALVNLGFLNKILIAENIGGTNKVNTLIAYRLKELINVAKENDYICSCCKIKQFEMVLDTK